MQRELGNRASIGFALLLGAVIGIALFRSDQPSYRFLRGARPIQIADIHQGSTRGTLRIYNVRRSWQQLLAEVSAEMPFAVSKIGTYKGLPAETVVVPLVESGRAKLFETPIREITVVQGEFFQDKSGMEIVRPGDGKWAGIRVIEFHQPRLFDRATNWIQTRLRA